MLPDNGRSISRNVASCLWRDKLIVLWRHNLWLSIKNFISSKHLCCLFIIINNQSPRSLFQLVPSPNTRYFSGNSENIQQLRTKHEFFKNSFSPSTIKEWNNLDLQIRKSKNISIFKSNILKFIRLKPYNVYYCHNPKGIKLLTFVLDPSSWTQVKV